MEHSPLLLLFCITIISIIITPASSYFNNDEPAYLADFNMLNSSSYSSPLPSSLSSSCSNGPVLSSFPLLEVLIEKDMDAISFQQECGTDKLCIIQPGVTVIMNSNVNVAGIINKGRILWTDETQQNNEQFLCGGYIVTEGNGTFNLSLSSLFKTAFIFIKANNAVHPSLGMRVFGGLHRDSSLGYPKVEVSGRSLRRTWSLLSEDAKKGDKSIILMHNVKDMGWRVGDRIALAPTQKMASFDAQTFFISSINHSLILLDGELNQDYSGDETAYKQAEVMMMTRNVIITGDDFQHIPCGPESVCKCTTPGKFCTVGLHTLVNGTNTPYGGTYKLKYTRVEKCGQRGILGRYCIHFHAMRECPDCLIKGNSVEYGHQRAVVIHDSHLTTVSENVVFDVRGAGIYIEDGNELYNHVEFNSVVCPYSFNGIKQGCTVPGTDNSVADTSDNQAAYWSLSHTNHFIGNRAANSYNGILFQPSFAHTGRGIAVGKVCVAYGALGRVEGNVCHGNGRFGLYFASSNWPRKVSTNTSVNGYTTEDQCAPFDSDGFDRGLPAAVVNNVDYHNAFVGSYGLGDVQYRNHISIDNNNLIYYKETKNFADGCSSHFKQFHFEDGNAMLPSGWGTIIFEDSTFKGNFKFESNHHCGIGFTGVLCNPQYIFKNPTWQVSSPEWLTWNDANNPTHGSVYNLSPEDALIPTSSLFPYGFQGLCHGYHVYLLALDSGKTCITSASLGMEKQYENGILCKKPLRRLEIFTQGLDNSTAGFVQLLVFKNKTLVSSSMERIEGENDKSLLILQIGNMTWTVVPSDTRKQGFTIPIISSLDYEYELHRPGGIPASWIIEFSDPVIGNRWTPDKIRLTVEGRNCPSITTSQHDRRFIYSSQDQAFLFPGRGACSIFPDMPPVDCSSFHAIPLMHCPGLCEGCEEGSNQYCDCGSGKCKCAAGFSGPDCSIDVCDSARCGIHGICSSRYLGGDLPAVRDACVCSEPYTGPTCESNPCEGISCNNRGSCFPQGEYGYYCSCQAGFSGPNCESSCDTFCTANGGVYPYMCSTTQEAPSFCKRDGGCGYSADYFHVNDSWCCYSLCDPCFDVKCDVTFVANDCIVPSFCLNGQCQPFITRPDGSVCHSEEWGSCLKGLCIKGHPPSFAEMQVPNSSGASFGVGVMFVVFLLLLSYLDL